MKSKCHIDQTHILIKIYLFSGYVGPILQSTWSSDVSLIVKNKGRPPNIKMLIRETVRQNTWSSSCHWFVSTHCVFIFYFVHFHVLFLHDSLLSGEMQWKVQTTLIYSIYLSIWQLIAKILLESSVTLHALKEYTVMLQMLQIEHMIHLNILRCMATVYNFIIISPNYNCLFHFRCSQASPVWLLMTYIQSLLNNYHYQLEDKKDCWFAFVPFYIKVGPEWSNYVRLLIDHLSWETFPRSIKWGRGLNSLTAY